MGYDYTEHGAAGDGVVLHLGAAEATGSVRVVLIDESGTGPQNRHMNASIGVRVAAYAGWGGAVKVAQCFGAADTGGGEPATVQLADLTACIDAANGASDALMAWGATALLIDVTNNDRELDIVVTSCFRP